MAARHHIQGAGIETVVGTKIKHQYVLVPVADSQVIQGLSDDLAGLILMVDQFRKLVQMPASIDQPRLQDCCL
jgi:hypothetical protein